METYHIFPDVSDIEIMRRIRHAGARCLRLIPGRKAKTLMADKEINVVGIEMRPDDFVRRESMFDRDDRE